MTKACQSFRRNSDNNYVAGFSIKAKHLWMLLQSVMGTSANTVNDKKVVSFINGSVLTPLNRYLSFFPCFSCSPLLFPLLLEVIIMLHGIFFEQLHNTNRKIVPLPVILFSLNVSGLYGDLQQLIGSSF